MKVSLIQQDILWGDAQANLDHLDTLLSKAPGSDLYVFPEMFTTGFATQEGSKLDDDPHRTVEWMKEKAIKGSCALAGSVAVEDGGKCYNRLFFVKPDGEVFQYDKRHLFNYGGEGERFTRGQDKVIVEYGGFRFLLAVCYDVRFPVWLRNRDDYDVLIVVANWPTARQLAWETLTVARAVENQTYVIASNRVGKDPVCEYMGGTKLINPFGETIARANDGTEDIITGTINMRFIRDYAKVFPVLDDADRFEIIK